MARKTYGPLKAKKCTKGKNCGGTCINQNNTCRLSLNTGISDAVSSAVKVIQSLDPFPKVYDDDGFLESFSDTLGVSKDKAAKMAYAVKKWGVSKYVKMRIYDAADDPSTLSRIEPEIIEYTDNMNEFLKIAPKYEGEIYRGLDFFDAAGKNSFLYQVRSSQGVSLSAMSSFTASREIAEGFSVGGDGVLMRVRKSKSGVAIRQLTSATGEDEVVVPKSTNYRLVSESPPNSDGTTVIELEEI